MLISNNLELPLLLNTLSSSQWWLLINILEDTLEDILEYIRRYTSLSTRYTNFEVSVGTLKDWRIYANFKEAW